jgi:hypothetical protein
LKLLKYRIGFAFPSVAATVLVRCDAGKARDDLRQLSSSGIAPHIRLNSC